ncbi:L-type lectin-domain containing receptor kinase IX.1-like [Triticum aestivum]|uniref:L-type lectin-domain containing receptor kinase IX.1-like n=1 Tax=Triticum aestivum TaxID=4565 RepID=UPI001D00B2BD|nr:L-type lectin-domain containing receptor kinase IX.1-like [Triticum aestivum]
MAGCNARIRILLVLYGASYLAPNAAALSVNCSGPDHRREAISRHDTSLAGNTTIGMFSVLALGWCSSSSRALPYIPSVDPAVTLRGSTVTRHVIPTTTDVDSSFDGPVMAKWEGEHFNCSGRFLSSLLFAFEEQQIATVARNYSGGSAGSLGLPNITCYTYFVHRNLTAPQPPYPFGLTDEAMARRLLSGTHGRRATRKQQAAAHGKVASSRLKQAAVAVSALVGLVCAVAALLRCCMRRNRPRQSAASIELEDDEHIITELELWQGMGPRRFCHTELAAATDNFAEERKIGRGGFGSVYRGYLSDQDRHVAIKTLSQELSVQGLREFQAEVAIMSQLRHRNIVQLVGWCRRRRGGLALVYELVDGGSLDTHLYNPDRCLTLSERYNIALGLGSALRYLHTDCHQCVVHGDIKPANVMLEASGSAKLGDFGPARLVDHGAEPRTTQVVAGTLGYIDPEFVSSRRPRAESDAARVEANRPGLGGAADLGPRLVPPEPDRGRGGPEPGEFDKLQMERLLVTGLWCAHHDRLQRPSVTQAMDVLRSEDARLPVLVAIAMPGSGEIRSLEGQAYGDVSDDNSGYLNESTETAYLTSEE